MSNLYWPLLVGVLLISVWGTNRMEEQMRFKGCWNIEIEEQTGLEGYSIFSAC